MGQFSCQGGAILTPLTPLAHEGKNFPRGRIPMWAANHAYCAAQWNVLTAGWPHPATKSCRKQPWEEEGTSGCLEVLTLKRPENGCVWDPTMRHASGNPANHTVKSGSKEPIMSTNKNLVSTSQRTVTCKRNTNKLLSGLQTYAREMWEKRIFIQLYFESKTELILKGHIKRVSGCKGNAVEKHYGETIKKENSFILLMRWRKHCHIEIFNIIFCAFGFLTRV